MVKCGAGNTVSFARGCLRVPKIQTQVGYQCFRLSSEKPQLFIVFEIVPGYSVWFYDRLCPAARALNWCFPVATARVG